MGQGDIIKVLVNERKFNNEEYLTPKQIKKALENLGVICRMENIRKCICKVRKTDLIETKDINTINKSYRLKQK